MDANTAEQIEALIAAAETAALAIEGAAAEDEGHAHSAEQPFYGAEVEVLVPEVEDEEEEEWVRLGDLESERRPGILAVRLFDCDGNRGSECRTIEEVEADKQTWLG
jgi:hypothetical protein